MQFPEGEKTFMASISRIMEAEGRPKRLKHSTLTIPLQFTSLPIEGFFSNSPTSNPSLASKNAV
jgi:hypothetical protein